MRNAAEWFLKFLIAVLVWLCIWLFLIIVSGAGMCTKDTFTVTAYCSCKKCCGKHSPEVTGNESLTRSGTVPRAQHTIAVDPKVIPLGTVVYIDGEMYVAEDTGSKVKGKHIDIYMDDHKEALKFGKQKKEVIIYEEMGVSDKVYQ